MDTVAFQDTLSFIQKNLQKIGAANFGPAEMMMNSTVQISLMERQQCCLMEFGMQAEA